MFGAKASARKSGPPAIENMPPAVKTIWPALSAYIRGGGLMAAKAPSTAATGSTRGEKRPQSTSSQGRGLGECYALREYGVCHFGANCIFDHWATKEHHQKVTAAGVADGKA